MVVSGSIGDNAGKYNRTSAATCFHHFHGTCTHACIHVVMEIRLPSVIQKRNSRLSPWSASFFTISCNGTRQPKMMQN